MAFLDKAAKNKDKPYLLLVAKDIENKKKIKTKSGLVLFDINSKTVKAFIKLVNNPKTKQTEIDNLLYDGTHFANIFNATNGMSYSWSNIDKSPYSGQGGKTNAKTTAMQERASLYSIKMGLNNNGYSKFEKFWKDCKVEIEKLYPIKEGRNDEWNNTFFEQQKLVCEKIPKNKFDQYSRDDGFMDSITKLVKKTPFNISKKDSWNPADIWLVNKPEEQMKILQECETIYNINDKLRYFFKENIIVGISLKKMSGKTARWELVNMNTSVFKKMPMFTSGDIICKLDIINGELSSTDTTYAIKDGSNKVVGGFQIRQNSKGFNNLKFEGKIKGAGAARSGKVPLDLFAKKCKEYGMTLNNDHNKYPKTTKEFRIEQKKFQSMFNKINRIVETNINNNDFVNNIEEIYKTRADIAMSKLMQIDFLYRLLSLKEDDVNSIVTTMYYYSQKKGKIFGPFGKLY